MRILCSILIAIGLVSNALAAERPNIVIFIADDMSWHDCGPYGAKDVRTPSLDQLAQRSMKFDRAFAASPTCTPSRSAMFTGMYPVRNGAHANHSVIKPGVKTWPDYMKELGYRMVLAGKSHIGPRDQFAFEYLAGSNFMPTGKKEVLWTELSTPRIDGFLQSHDKKTPLCLIVASHSPHVFWLENKDYDPAKISLPPYLLDTPETRAARCKYYTDVTNVDKQVGDVRQSLAKHGFSNALFMFTTDQGAQFPFSKWTLYDAGIRVPLLIDWPGRVKEGTTSSAIVSLIDVLPTVIEAAGGTAPTEIDGKSFLPVLLGKSEKGRDEVFALNTGDKDMNRAPTRCVRTEKFKYIVNLAPEIPFTTHISKGPGRKEYYDSWVKLAETDARAKEVVQRQEHRPAEELYDVEADPYELKNLAADPAHAETLNALREKVKQWRVQQGEDLNKVLMPEDGRSGEIRYAG
jgi:arylsulfatase A-like enzyme